MPLLLSETPPGRENLDHLASLKVVYVGRHHSSLAHKPGAPVATVSQPVVEEDLLDFHGYNLPESFGLLAGILVFVFALLSWHRRIERDRAAQYQQFHVEGGGQYGPASSDRATLRSQLSDVMEWMEAIENALGRYCQKPQGEGAKAWIITAEGRGLDHWIASGMKRINECRNILVHEHVTISSDEWKEISIHWANIQQFFGL